MLHLPHNPFRTEQSACQAARGAALLAALFVLLLVPACRSGAPRGASPASPGAPALKHPSTLAIDAFASPLDQANRDLRGSERDDARLALYAQRWPAVQRAVAHHGTTHRDAFYGSRAYWHTGSSRGITWALDHPGDLDAAAIFDGRASVRVAGDVNRDIDIAGNVIVHILGDLDATLELTGICEVVIAGDLTEDATIICDGQLELFVGGDCTGILGSTQSSTIIIDGLATGTLQAGAPATTLTVTGDLLAKVPAPKNKNAVLTLRVDGYAATAQMLDLASAGFTRVNATLGQSDAPPGLYPQDPNTRQPKARWVVLDQRAQPVGGSD